MGNIYSYVLRLICENVCDIIIYKLYIISVEPYGIYEL